MIKQFKVVSGRPIEGRTFDVGEIIDLPTQVASYYLATGIVIHHREEDDAPAKPDTPKTEASGAADAESKAPKDEGEKAAPRTRRRRAQ